LSPGKKEKKEKMGRVGKGGEKKKKNIPREKRGEKTLDKEKREPPPLFNIRWCPVGKRKNGGLAVGVGGKIRSVLSTISLTRGEKKREVGKEKKGGGEKKKGKESRRAFFLARAEERKKEGGRRCALPCGGRIGGGEGGKEGQATRGGGGVTKLKKRERKQKGPASYHAERSPKVGGKAHLFWWKGGDRFEKKRLGPSEC